MLGNIPLGAVPTYGSIDSENAQPAPGVPTNRWRFGKEQQGGIGDGKGVPPRDDETVVPENVKDRSACIGGLAETFLCQSKINIVNGSFGTHLLLIANPAVSLLALVYDFLRFMDNLFAYPIGETIAVHHDGFRGNRDLKNNDLVVIEG
jgi:hypothetical protein